MVVGDQGAFDGCAGASVVPDGGGEGQQPGGDTGIDAGQGAAAVGFEGELAFEGVDDSPPPMASAFANTKPSQPPSDVNVDQHPTSGSTVSANQPFTADTPT
jgi:hypothetical protein